MTPKAKILIGNNSSIRFCIPELLKLRPRKADGRFEVVTVESVVKEEALEFIRGLSDIIGDEALKQGYWVRLESGEWGETIIVENDDGIGVGKIYIQIKQEKQ